MPKPAPPPAPTASHVRFEPTPKGLLLTTLAIGMAWLALRLLPVILVVVAALFIAGTLTPAVEWLEKKGLKRAWGISLAFTAMFAATLLVMAFTIPSLIDQVDVLVKQEPALRGRIADLLARSGATAPLADSMRAFRYDALARSSSGTAFEYSARFVEMVAYVVSATFLALYVLIDRDRLRGGLFAIVPRKHHVRLSRILLKLEVIVGGYIRGQAITSALMGVFTFVLLSACGVHNALVIAVFAGIADVLPYVGVFLSVGSALAASLARGPLIAGIVLISMLAYEEFESRFLVPRVYGRALRLPSTIVLIALLAGGTLLGIIGVLLALPAAAAVRMLVEELRVDLPGEQVDDSDLRARDEKGEQEYERRAEGVPVAQAAAIAVEISEERSKEEATVEEAPPAPKP